MIPKFRYSGGIAVLPRLDFSTVGNMPLSEQKIIAELDDRIVTLKQHGPSLFEHYDSDELSNAAALSIVIPQGFSTTNAQHLSIDIRGAKSLSQMSILANASSKTVLVITRSASQAEYLSSLTSIILKDRAELELVFIDDVDDSTTGFDRVKAKIGRDSSLVFAKVLLGSDYCMSTFEADLAGRGAQVQAKVCFAGGSKQRFDVYTAANHLGSHTKSDLLTKGVLSGEAQALSRGLIRISPDAPASQGYEKQDALVLSEFAKAQAIPNLEIANHDVKCTHGSTIGRLDEAQLFYLMSRGLPKKQAQLMIIEGYFIESLGSLAQDTVQEISGRISARLARLME